MTRSPWSATCLAPADGAAAGVRLPRGFRAHGIHCGIKRDPAAEDLAIVASDVPATAAGVFTTTRIPAAPVVLDRQRTPSASIRAVVINSGNANACTGERGLADAKEMAACAARAVDARADETLVLSTGVIGELLPLGRIRTGIARLGAVLGTGEASLLAAARAMMTTDTVPKLAGRTVACAGGEVVIAGLAKGAAMIGPNLATMLGLVLTDAALEPAGAERLLREAVDVSFNCISVDGHMSTNDTVLLLANGAAGGGGLQGPDRLRFRDALVEVCTDLARAIPADGEGASHLITIDVAGCHTRGDARRLARAVANSPLVKAAVAGADPNWGRIVSALGNAGVGFDPEGVELELNGTLLFRRGAPVSFDRAAVSSSLRERRDVSIVLRLREGVEGIRFWTTDLTEEYVRLNAEYTT